MAILYLQPTGTYRVGVEATINSRRMNFSVLLFEFDETFDSLNEGDMIYPSYDGSHAGLLDGYEYSILGASGISPIQEGQLIVQASDPTKNLVVYRKQAAGGIDRLEFKISGVPAYFVQSFYGTSDGGSTRTTGIMIAHFSDGVYTFGVLDNTLTLLTMEGNTYEAPEIITDPSYSLNWGYAIVARRIDLGYAMFSSYFRIYKAAGNSFLLAADAIMGKSYVISTDPFDNFPNPGEEYPGGEGSPREGGDDIDIPSLPSLSAADSGFVTLYNPTLPQLKALATYMWSGPFDLSSFKKIFADPMDCILGLSIVPVSVPNGGVQQITIGNVSTGIAVSLAATNYIEVDCGSITVTRSFESYLDYAPFTTAEIYLPYIGYRHLETDDIMPPAGESSRTIHVVYKVDLFSGACIAFVKCKNSVMYSFTGQCATSVPVTGQNWTEFYKAVTNLVASAAGTLSAGGGSSASSTMGNSGRMSDVRSHVSEMYGQKQTSSVSHSIGASAVADAVFSYKPRIERSGSMGSAVGMLGIQKPYLVLRYPELCTPRRANEFLGYPSFFCKKIKDFKGQGFLQVEEVHLEHLPATEDEVEEIYSLLKSGVLV